MWGYSWNEGKQARVKIDQKGFARTCLSKEPL